MGSPNQRSSTTPHGRCVSTKKEEPTNQNTWSLRGHVRKFRRNKTRRCRNPSFSPPERRERRAFRPLPSGISGPDGRGDFLDLVGGLQRVFREEHLDMKEGIDWFSRVGICRFAKFLMSKHCKSHVPSAHRVDTLCSVRHQFRISVETSYTILLQQQRIRYNFSLFFFFQHETPRASAP